MGKSDFTWWQWLLVALGAYALCAVFSIAMRRRWNPENEGLRYPLAFAAAVFGLSGFILTLFGISGFFRWGW
jgi:hypothetical protein